MAFESIYGSLGDSIHGQVPASKGNIQPQHYSTADDPVDPDPIQGTDIEVWVERYAANVPDDPTTPINNLILLGSFQELSIQISSKSCRYMEVDSRSALLLDDDFVIRFQLGKGLIDMNVMEQSFGLRYIHHLARFNRLPRMRVTFNVDTRSLDVNGIPRGELNQSVFTHGTNFLSNTIGNPLTDSFFTQSDRSRAQFVANQIGNEGGVNYAVAGVGSESQVPSVPGTVNAINNRRISTGERFPLGRWVLEGAKCNELMLHAAGIKVIQNQWQGEAEAIQAIVFNERSDQSQPEYLYKNKDGFDPHFLSADLGQAANTRDPKIDQMIKDQAAQVILRGLSENVGNVIGAGLSSLLGQ